MIIKDNFSYFSSKPYVVTPHLNRLVETVQMRGHNICFYAELTKIIPNYHHKYSRLSRALQVQQIIVSMSWYKENINMIRK